MTAKFLKIALLFFAIAAVIGVVLRLFFFNPIDGWNYKHLLHAHSHVVLLGWVTNALLAAIYYVFYESHGVHRKIWWWFFGLLQLSVVGMLFTFPMQGYGTLSIIFSTLHIVISYFFCIWILKATKNEKTVWQKFISWGIVYFMLSTLGPFSLGPIMSQSLSGSHWYYLAIYFYLHFLYNGFFTFVIFGLLFWWLDNKQIEYPQQHASKFFKLMNLACLPTYALSALWTNPPWYVYTIGLLGVVLLLMSMLNLFKAIRPAIVTIKDNLTSTVKILWTVAVLSFLLKVLLQSISVMPKIAQLAYEVRNYTIGYLHLVFIGFVTCFLLGWFIANRILYFHKPQVVGMWLLIIGFIVSQLLIVVQPLVGYIPSYYQVLFGVSLVMLFGIVSFLFVSRSAAE